MLKALNELSARVGSDPYLTQGAGGNTSIKHKGALSVKASGKWLSKAEEEEVFVSLDLSALKKAVEAGTEKPLNEFLQKGETLRPSIEAPVHAIIPQKTVVHVHSIHALSYAVREDGQTLLDQVLKDFKWTWIPYVKPGWPLAFSIRDNLKNSTNVWILQNHGLIVAAETVEDAEALLHDVESALTLPTNPLISGHDGIDQAALKSCGFRLPEFPVVHSLARDTGLKFLLDAGVLYPDQAVFLGPKFISVKSEKELNKNTECSVALIEGKGAVVKESAIAGVDEMLLCHALLSELLPKNSKLNSLKPEQVAELLDWDAEKYRQSLKQG